MTAKKPHDVDVVVGRNVRILRTHKGASQTDLAESLGITFQQVQKYEKGTNRISSSRLRQIADFLNVEIATLFEGTESPDNLENIAPFSKDAIAIARSFDAIQSPKVKQAVRSFIETLIESDDVRTGKPKTVAS
jgi:transcriptional regulator with XRE-family HTH domain